jgi:hypothetical protein
VKTETRRTFKAYRQAVEALLVTRFGINVADVGANSVEGCRRDGWTPEESVKWLETKYDMERIDTGPYGTPDPGRYRQPDRNTTTP